MHKGLGTFFLYSNVWLFVKIGKYVNSSWRRREIDNGLPFRSQKERHNRCVTSVELPLYRADQCYLRTLQVQQPKTSLTNQLLFTLRHCELWQPRVNSALWKMKWFAASFFVISLRTEFIESYSKNLNCGLESVWIFVDQPKPPALT